MAASAIRSRDRSFGRMIVRGPHSSQWPPVHAAFRHASEQYCAAPQTEHTRMRRAEGPRRVNPHHSHGVAWRSQTSECPVMTSKKESEMGHGIRVAADVGRTFSNCVGLGWRIAKDCLWLGESPLLGKRSRHIILQA